MGRRTLLGLAGAVTLAACSNDPGENGEGVVSRDSTNGTPERFSYGDDPSQWADLYRPTGDSNGVVVVLHGGFWKAQYDASLGAPLAEDLARRGWTAWNLEYRRVGNGGGWPSTFDDVSAGIDRLTEVPDLDLSTVVSLGHSAGGHLGAWAAARGRFDRWRDAVVELTGVISQAGVLDLTTGAEVGLGSGAVEAFLGRPPGPSYDEVDPLRQVPLRVPMRCVHGDQDPIVPLSQSTDYVDAATKAGADATLLQISGDHFALIDVTSEAWEKTVAILDSVRAD